MNYFVLFDEGNGPAQAFAEKPEVGECDWVFDDFVKFLKEVAIENIDGDPKPPPCPAGVDEDEWEEKHEEIWDELPYEVRYASLLEELKKGEPVKLYKWFDNHPFAWPS